MRQLVPNPLQVSKVALTSWLAAFIASLAIAFTPGSVVAHDMTSCLSDDAYRTDPNCYAHWLNTQMYWHFGNEIDDGHHFEDRESFKRAVAQWEGETPNGPWDAIKDNSGITHPNMVWASAGILGFGRIAQEDSTDHIPRVIELWVRHDVEEIDCGIATGFQPCSWYNGTGVAGGLEIDQWSVWQEELGHAQNINHHTLDEHEFHNHQHTMSGLTDQGSITKRDPLTHESEHACYAYVVAHSYPC